MTCENVDNLCIWKNLLIEFILNHITHFNELRVLEFIGSLSQGIGLI